MSKLPRKNITETATEEIPSKLGVLTQDGGVNLAGKKEKKKRKRKYEKTNPAYARKVPHNE